MPATVTGYVLALAGELGEHLVEPAAVRAHAAALAELLDRAPPGPRQQAEPSQRYRRWLDAQRMRHALVPLVEAFAARKRAERALDFGDQLAIAARVAAEHPEVGTQERATYRAVLLDEYQDTGHAQRVLLRALFGAAPGAPAGRDAPAVTAVGDPCQSIYGWRGASAGNLARFRTDFPGPDGAPADEYGLLTSFRNPPEVLALANAVSAPLRGAARGAVGVGALRPGRARGAGDVRVALLPDVAAELDWMADAIAARWQAAADVGGESPTSAVLVRRRADMDADRRRAAGAATCRWRWSASAGCSTPRRSATWSAPCGWSPIRWPGRPRCGCSPGRAGGWAWPTSRRSGRGPASWHRAPPPPPERSRAAELALGALPGEHAEQAGLVDALDDPGAPGRYSPAGFARIRRLAAELRRLRARASVPLTDLVADAERLLLLDAETAARPGPVGRAHLDAFADVVADFTAGAEVSTLPALLDYLDTAERAEEGFAPGEVEVAPDRVQVLTVHAAKGLEWEIVAVPHLVGAGVPGPQDQRQLADGSVGAARPAARRRRGPARARPARAGRRPQGDRGRARRRTTRPWTTAGSSRSGGCSTWRSPGPSGCCWSPGTAGRRPATAPGSRRSSSRRCATRWRPPAWGASSTGPRSPSSARDNPATAEPVTAEWPVDPLGARAAAVHAGAELVRAALREQPADAARPRPTPAPSPGSTSSRPAEPGEADPEGWAADVDVLLAERAAARERPASRCPHSCR